jgi:hypothetical protein
MSLLEKAIRSGARPKSFWVMLAICIIAPIIGLPYFLLVQYGLIHHTMTGFLFFFALILVAWFFFLYYVNGLFAGRYRGLKGMSWSQLPW